MWTYVSDKDGNVSDKDGKVHSSHMVNVFFLCISGYRMPAPTNTPESVYKIMLKCWEYNPTTRITFKDLHKQLKSLADKPPRDENWN